MNSYARLSMTDVPGYIWNSVYEKWRNAYLDGWKYSELWNGCALCNFVGSKRYVCRDCPLYKDEWCKAYMNASKISIEYHKFAGEGDEDDWRSRIKDFLIFLKPYCTEDYNNDIY